MRHFPVFLDTRGQSVVVSGAGETAVAKLRLLMRTEARIAVHGAEPAEEVVRWAAEGRIALTEAPLTEVGGDARLVYAANADPVEDARVAKLGREAGVLVNIVDDLSSDFITPAIVDRDPVTVAIGTEGAAPVLARKIKAEVEELLPSSLGLLARIGQSFRARVEALDSRARRAFWTRFYFERGPRAVAAGSEAVSETLETMLTEGVAATKGFVHLIGAGPGDPELLTMKARRLLHEADVVIHDRLVPAEILELARREARVIEVGKIAYGPSWKQEDINALLVREAGAGATVARLKGGDAVLFGRLDEEIEALEAAGIGYAIVPGITSASAAAATIGQSLTRRGRNASLRFLTAHDMNGFADHDWRDLAKPGATAAIYMGVKAAAFTRGRLLMHGAATATPVTCVENASRPDQRVVATTLIDLPEALAEACPTGPVMILLGLEPRAALAAAELNEFKEAL